MTRNRHDETWHRLREWTNGQTPSERLAAQILLNEGFSNLDPSHPLGGKDGGKDAKASKNGMQFAMAVYFPRGQQSITAIKRKFDDDLAGARRGNSDGFAFVTNQELTLSEREEIRTVSAPMVVDLYHLERITTILDTPIMAKVREQFLNIETESATPVQLGGQGGTAPGAGGGGGGAMGHDAKGGRGGRGGDINLDGTPGKAPGAGGGGEGAIGERAVAGEGGGGGEFASFILGPNEIGPGSDFHHFEIQVGKGGVGGPGEDTIINLCDKDDDVLRSLVVKGGKEGAPPYVPPPSRSPTEEDIKAGLKVTGILAAEFIRFRDRLITIVEGGWDIWTAHSSPFRVRLPLLVEIDTGKIEPGTVLDLKLVVQSPAGFQVHEQQQSIIAHDSLVRRSRFAAVLEFSGSQPGLWGVHVHAGRQVIREFPIEIRAPGH